MYVAKDFSNLIGMPGFSETLLKNHFTLYQGYVANTNKTYDILGALLKEGKTGTEFAEVSRRAGWEWNGMRLHELYFGNLGGDGAFPASGPLSDLVKKNFGDFETFQKVFLATGAMRGIGWVIAYHEPATDGLLVTWVNEHDVGHLAGLKPILIMDVFEHAFLTDYGLKRADYLAAFWKNVDWKKVEARL